MNNCYSKEFTNSAIKTLDIFNLLLKGKHTKDMYKNGEFLSMSVPDNSTSRDILSPIIVSIDEYIALNNSQYSGIQNTIGLSALFEDHKKYFEPLSEIMYDSEAEEFIFKGMLLIED